MHDFQIFTDSSCDLSYDMQKERGLLSIPLSFRFEDTGEEYFNGELPIDEFYARMRDGAVVKTSAPNVEQFASAFETELKSGRDILYLGFSSALSNTFNSARLAAEQLRCEYPRRTIVTIDTLCASAGIALLIDMVIKYKRLHPALSDVANYAEQTKRKICHLFTVDNLDYLKRGGRVSTTVAFFGNMLGIKPMLHVDNGGNLVYQGKIRGRKASLNALAQGYEHFNAGSTEGHVYISHANCPDDAKYLASLLDTNFNIKPSLITDVGAVIGAHCGPGTVALFFVGKER